MFPACVQVFWLHFSSKYFLGVLDKGPAKKNPFKISLYVKNLYVFFGKFREKQVSNGGF